MEQVGLGYLHLNQSMTTLSGGELQRVKLASQLYRKNAVFVIDEPTDGLHLDDIRKLMILFNRMVDEGDTLYLIEHSLDVMKDAVILLKSAPVVVCPAGSRFSQELRRRWKPVKRL